MAEKYDDVLLPFLSLMRKELHANAGKGDRPGWLRTDANTALLEIYWHAAKLSAAVKKNDGPAIMEHSADVANMAMMVLDVCGGIGLIGACSSCGGSGTQGNGPGVGGCTDCLGTGVDPMSDNALDLAACEAARESLQKEVWRLRGALGSQSDAAPLLTDAEVEGECENKCPTCGQTDKGQTGEYACPECGLPTVWDDELADGAPPSHGGER